MQTNIHEIYKNTILPLPENEQLKLASLILEKVTKKDESERPGRRTGGDITKFFGMFNSGDPDSANNEKIDADLARAYADNHEDED